MRLTPNEPAVAKSVMVGQIFIPSGAMHGIAERGNYKKDMGNGIELHMIKTGGYVAVQLFQHGIGSKPVTEVKYAPKPKKAAVVKPQKPKKPEPKAFKVADKKEEKLFNFDD